MKKYWELFFVFAKVGACTFGGGYAMLPILDRELVENRKWATTEELADYFAIGQCTPGVIAVNTATFVGNSRGGLAGGIMATLGLVFPSVVIITILAAFLSGVSQNPMVIHAFNGVRAGVVALILSAALKLLKSALVDTSAKVIYGVSFLLAAAGVFLPAPEGIGGRILGCICSPVAVVVLAGLAGVFVRKAKEGRAL